MHQDKKIPALHSYTIASRMYDELIENETNQAVIISGESGAGKTETCKMILQYLSEAAGSAYVSIFCLFVCLCVCLKIIIKHF